MQFFLSSYVTAIIAIAGAAPESMVSEAKKLVNPSPDNQ